MKALLSIVAAASILAISCATDPCSGVSPLGVPASDGDQASIAEVTYDSCYSNVSTLFSIQAMYYGYYNTYASDIEDLYEFIGDTLLCPWTQQPYEVLYGDTESYWVQCREYPTHPGGDGLGGWSGDPLDECRSRMRSIASSEAMFYGAYNRYGTMDELLAAGYGPYLVCPGCSLDYGIKVGTDTYTLTCPMPAEPTHGSVVDGVISWQ